MANLSKLPNKLTAGTDLIPGCLLKNSANFLINPMDLIINLAIKTGSLFPNQWKMRAYVPFLIRW